MYFLCERCSLPGADLYSENEGHLWRSCADSNRHLLNSLKPGSHEQGLHDLLLADVAQFRMEGPVQVSEHFLRTVCLHCLCLLHLFPYFVSRLAGVAQLVYFRSDVCHDLL